MASHFPKFLLCVLLWLSAPAAQAFSTWFGDYNLGLSYSTTASYASVSYDAKRSQPMPSDCEDTVDDPSRMHCTAYLAPDGEGVFSAAVYLAAPFKRQGFFYFSPGMTFSTITYKGTLASKPKSPLSSKNSSSTNTTTTTTANGSTTTTSATTSPTNSSGTTTAGSAPVDQQAATQPLTQALMELYGINWQAYVRFGLTPRYLPDLFCSLGLGLQTVGGRLKIFKEDKTRWVVQAEAFGEIELVIARFGSGSLSGFVAQDSSLGGPFASQLIEDNPSGTDLTNFQLGLVAAASGIRLTLPF